MWVFVCSINSPFRLPRRRLPRPIDTPRAITPLPPLHGYHACIYMYTGYHAIVLLYSWVITPELSRSTTHVKRVITPAIVRSSYFTVHRLSRRVFFSIYTTGAPHVPTYSTNLTYAIGRLVVYRAGSNHPRTDVEANQGFAPIQGVALSRPDR